MTARKKPELDARAALALLRAGADPERARHALRFFKTAPGEYGAGDRFLGLTVPKVRAVLRDHHVDLASACALLESEWHEARLLAVLALVRLYQRGTEEERRAVFRAYLARTSRVNNWDLVDSSAGYIVGPELRGKNRPRILRLVRSALVWERRIAMIATFHPIMQGDPTDARLVAELLVNDEHDLIHKAVGWMLRELGERCGIAHLRGFLRAHAATMPRTALRYAIEKLEPAERKRWMGLATSTVKQRRR